MDENAHVFAHSSLIFFRSSGQVPIDSFCDVESNTRADDSERDIASAEVSYGAVVVPFLQNHRGQCGSRRDQTRWPPARPQLQRKAVYGRREHRQGYNMPDVVRPIPRERSAGHQLVGRRATCRRRRRAACSGWRRYLHQSCAQDEQKADRHAIVPGVCEILPPGLPT